MALGDYECCLTAHQLSERTLGRYGLVPFISVRLMLLFYYFIHSCSEGFLFFPFINDIVCHESHTPASNNLATKDKVTLIKKNKKKQNRIFSSLGKPVQKYNTIQQLFHYLYTFIKG